MKKSPMELFKLITYYIMSLGTISFDSPLEEAYPVFPSRKSYSLSRVEE